MDADLFKRLVYEGESPMLDYKRDQYPFVSTLEQAEVLKDILHMANAWKHRDAYILIGIAEKKTGDDRLVGVTTHLHDHTLQSFLHSKTRHRINFHYSVFSYEGKEYGIIKINKDQKRPNYLENAFAFLKKNRVYIRRGTTNDYTRPASPEEIAEMGAIASAPAPDIDVRFADLEKEELAGTSMNWDGECHIWKDYNQIPDYDYEPQTQLAKISGYSLGRQDNREFFRQLAVYFFKLRLCKPMRLGFRNSGSQLASKVRCELILPRETGFVFLNSLDECPESSRVLPSFTSSAISFTNSATGFTNSVSRFPFFQPQSIHLPVVIHGNDHRYKVTVDCENIQPGRTLFTEIFFAGQYDSGDHTINGTLYADNLTEPQTFSLIIHTNIKQIEMDVEKLRQMYKER